MLPVAPIRAPQPAQALPLGLGSLFNHSSDSYLHNVYWTRDIPRQCIVYTTARDIAAEEELCISYGNPARLWFKDTDVCDSETANSAMPTEEEALKEMMRSSLALADQL